MSRFSLHALIWSEERSLYELYTRGQLTNRFQPTDEAAWQAWLREASSFAFHGLSGSLNVYQEQRPRGGAYWYAYRTKAGRTRKRYLGRTESLSLARLEETAQTFPREQQPAPALEQGIPVLSGRLAPPSLPPALVERERLLTALDGVFATRLALLSASAGFGKTTLLSAWARRHPAQVAWLSLEELDNTPTRFWVALIAALRRCKRFGPSFGDTVVALLQSPQPPPLPSCLLALLSELESGKSHSAPLGLVLDDYQVIDDPVIHQSLAFFLEHLPAHLHLILSSRIDPDLPLARLRARGHLTEIRADELRFREGEANQYLDQLLSPPLMEEEVQRLLGRTEGWIAGLQLAALVLEKHADRATYLEAFSGSQRYLLDYVQEEILARLPENVRDFLLHSAILSQMSASACQAVTAAPTQAASQQMLVFLERANLFLVPLDEERRTYRLHDLFREALLSVLHTTQPELVPLLHRRAADFYKAQGEWQESLAHWFSARDFSAAAKLMEQTIEQFWLRGEAETIVRRVLMLPDALVWEHARLALTAALYLLNTVAQTTREQRARVYQQVRQLIARVETALRRERAEIDQETLATRADEGALLHRRLGLLHIHMAFWGAIARGDYEHMKSMRQEIEEALEQDEEAIWQIVPLACSFALHYNLWQTGAQLLPRLLSAKEQMSWKDSPFASLRVRQYLVFVALEAGRLRLAYEESQVALDRIEQMAGYALLKGYFKVALAQVWYQWNHLEEARRLLHTVLLDAATWHHLDLLGFGHVELLRIALATADWPLAEFALHGIEQLVQRERYASYPEGLPTMQAAFWLARGQLRAASDWAAGVFFSQGPWEFGSYDAFPVVIRVYFAERRWAEALELLNTFRGHLDRPANIRITMTYLAQSLVALHQTGQIEQAREVAVRLFALTEPEGYLRVYLDEGEPMKLALKALPATPSTTQQEVVSASLSSSYLRRLRAAFEQEESITAKHSLNSDHLIAPTSESLSASADQRPLPREPLSPQELKVLRLLVAGRTYAEMADSLIVSINTIKTQVNSIYRKLGVSRRAEAIAASQRFHLL